MNLSDRKGTIIGKTIIYGKEWEILSSFILDLSTNQDWLMLKTDLGKMYMNNDYGYMLLVTNDNKYLYSNISDLRYNDRWENDSINALTLWDTPSDTMKVEITSKYIKFFSRDDDYFSCATFPPFHELKHDDNFRESIFTYLNCEEQEVLNDMARQYDEWVNSKMDLPPFEIQFVFESGYANYTTKEY